MRKFVVSIFLIAAVNISVSAQNEQGGNRRPRMDRTEWAKRRTERMVQKYGLNEKQAKELLALNEKQMPRGNGPRPEKPERPDTTKAPKPEGKRGLHPGGNWQEMQKQYNEELQKIMTADQFKAYMEDMEKRRQERPNRQGPPQR